MKTIIEMTRELGGFAPTTKFLEQFAELVRADERNAIYDQWHSCVMSDLENGVKFLNEKAATEWQKNYPAQSKTFSDWIEARGNT